MKRKLQSTVHDYSAELGAGDWLSRPEITALADTKTILVGEPVRREERPIPPSFLVTVMQFTRPNQQRRVRVRQIKVAVKLLAPPPCYTLAPLGMR